MATQFLLKDTIKVTKYYEADSPINTNTGNNETDICLSLVNNVKPVVNGTTFLGGEELTKPGTHLKFTDPDGSILSQTFAIAAVHNLNEDMEDEIIKDDLLIGTDKDDNNITTFITKDFISEPFFDNYLKIETSKNLGPFNSTDNLFKATFEENSSDLLSMAVNTAHNQTNKTGLLKIGEDASYNNLYALGKNSSKYFIENENSKQLEVQNISSENLVSTNKIDVQSIPNNLVFKSTTSQIPTFNIRLNSNNLVKKIVFSQLQPPHVLVDAWLNLSELALYDNKDKQLIWQTDFTLAISTTPNFYIPDMGFDKLFDNNKYTVMSSGAEVNVTFTITFTNPLSLSKMYLRNRSDINQCIIRLKHYKLNFYDVYNNSLTDNILFKDIPSLYSANANNDYSVLFMLNNFNPTDYQFGTFKFDIAEPTVSVTSSANVATLPLSLIKPQSKSSIELLENSLIKTIKISGDGEYLQLSELALYDINNIKLTYLDNFTITISPGGYANIDGYSNTPSYLFDGNKTTIMHSSVGNIIFTITFTNSVSLSKIYLRNRYYPEPYTVLVLDRLKKYKLNFYDVDNNSLTDDILFKDIPSLYSSTDDYSVLFTLNASGTNNLPSSLSVDEYKELFGSTVYENDSFKVEITKNENTGFNFVDASANNYANLLNDTIVNNINYVKNVAKLSHSLEISQQPMRVDSVGGNSDDNSGSFVLSTNGEKLSSTDYNTDGEIKLAFDASNNRIGTVEILETKIPVKSKLRAHYKFNADSIQGNKVANYASGTPVYDATLMNGASINTTDYKRGNGSLQFNASSSQYLEQPPFTYSSEGFSFAIWFKSNNSGAWARIFDYGVGQQTNNVGITVNMNGTKLLRPFLNNSLNGDNVNYNNNVWTHLVLTINPNGQWKTYINGVLNTTNNALYPLTFEHKFVYLGKSLYGVDPYFNGLMDECLMYDTVLTAQDVSQLYSSVEDLNANSDNLEVIVDYNNLTEELKTTKDVSYELIDYLLPTGKGQYDSFADSNGASLYSDMNEYSTVELISSITDDNSVKLIKITPTFSVDSVTMYKLNEDDSLGTLIPVDITASLNNVSNIPIDVKFRTKLISKQISDLGIQSKNIGDLLIYDTTSPTNDSNKWNLSYDPQYNNEYLMSSLLATSNSSNFPSVNKSTSMINDDESLDVTLSYVSVISSTNTGTLFDSVYIKYDNITTEISQQSLEFFNDSQKINYYEQLTDVSDNGITYQIVKYIITEQYQAKFMFPLSIFGNILMTTPLLNSVITTYLYYSADTVITIGENNDSITASKHRILTPSVPTNITSLYPSTDDISLASDTNNKNVALDFSINKKSLTPLNAVFQIKPSDSEAWENIGDIVRDIDTYYGANQTLTNQQGHSVTVTICPTITTNTDETLQLINETYAIPLVIDFDNLILDVKGYNYAISDSLLLDVLTDPNNFLNNDLPVGTDMNLTVNYTATATEVINEYSLDINVVDGTTTIATINMEVSTFFGSFVIAKNSKPLFCVDRTLGTQTSTRQFIFGDESVSNGSLTGISSGVLDMSDGVKVNYTDISAEEENLKFSLKTDRISVSNVGSAGTPQNITQLNYESANSESITIPYYRGYLNNGTTQTYKIVRKDLVSAKVKVTDTYVSNISEVYLNKEHVINFNNTISIGNKVKMLFSRLPNNILQNNKYKMNIAVTGDDVKITRTINSVETITNKTLLDYELYVLNDNVPLVSKGIQISSDLEYRIIYKEIGGSVSFANDYKTNPLDIDWSNLEPIVNFQDVPNITSDIYITSRGLNENGYIKFKLSKDTVLDSTSYFVYAPPYLHAQQATKYASNVFPLNINDNLSELKTVYFSNTNYSLDTTQHVYNPFADIENANNVAFMTTQIKTFPEYNDISKNISVKTFNITGSNIKLTELRSTNPAVPSNNGPNRNGIIYNGKIGDLTSFTSDYIKLLSSDNGVFTISYTQDLGGYFEILFGDNDVNHRGNIVLNIGNCVLPSTSFTLRNQITNGSIVNVYDVYQVNYDNTLKLYLLKYVYDTLINYSNIPGNIYVSKFPFQVDELYYSEVSIPSVSLGDNINDVLKRITKSNLSLNSNKIVWTKKQSVEKQLTLQITPLTQSGAVDMFTLFYTSSEVPTNYAIINIPNAYEVINGDGTYQTVITGLGKIKTQAVNTSKTPTTTSIDLSLPSNLASNYANSNSTLYENDVQINTQTRSLNDILFNFE